MAQFVITGSALIKKIQISQAARRELQNLVVNVDTTKVQKSLDRLGVQIRNAVNPLQKIGRASGPVRQLATNFGRVNNSVKRTNKSLKKQESLLFQVLKKASAFRISTIIINNFFNAFEGGFATVVKFDAALRDVNKILRVSDKAMRDLGKAAIQTAKDFNLSSDEIAEGLRTAAQAGLAGPDATGAEQQASALGLVRRAALIAQTSTLEFSSALNTLLAVMKQTNSTIEQSTVIVSKFSAVEDAAAVDAADLAEVFKRAGTTIALNFNNNLDAAIGLIAAVGERTRQSSSVIGTFFKTLGARLSGANESALAAFKELNISIADNEGRLKNIKVLLEEVAEATEGLGAEDLGRILGSIGGVRQAELFKATLETLREGRADELEEAAAQGASTQLQKAAQDAAKFETQINRINEGFKQVILTLQEGALADIFKGLLDSAEAFVGVLDGLGKPGSAINALGGALAVFGIGKLSNQLTGGSINSLNNNLSGSSRRSAGPQGFLKEGTLVGTVNGNRIRNFGKQLKAVNFSVSRLNKFTNRLSNGFARVGSHIQGFSAGAFASSIALSALSDNIIEATDTVDNDFNRLSKGIGETLKIFSQFLILGPKIAALAAGIDVTRRSFETIERAFDVAAGDSSATANFLRDPGFGQGRAAPGAARSVELFGRGGSVSQFSEITDENRREAELLANKVNSVLDGLVNKISDGIAEGLSESDIDDKLRESIQKAILDRRGGQFNTTEFAQVSKLIQNPEFGALLGGDSADAFQALSGSGANLAETLEFLTRTLVNTKVALNDAVSNIDAITKAELKRSLALVSARQKNEEGLLRALGAEQALFDLRADGSNLRNIQSAIALEREISRSRVKSLQEEFKLIKTRELNKTRRIIAEADTNLAKLNERRKAAVNTMGGESEAVEKIDKKIAKLTKTRERNAQILDAGARGFGPQVKDELEARINAISAERTRLFLAEVEASKRLTTVEERLAKTRIEQSRELAEAADDEARARASLQRLVSGTGGSASDVAKREGEARQAGLEIRINSLKEEERLIRDIQQKAIEGRKRELENLIEIKRQEIVSRQKAGIFQPGNDPALLQRRELFNRLERVNDIQLKGSEKLKKVVLERQLLESNLRTLQLQNAAKVFEAEKRIAQERLQGAAKLLDVSVKLKDSVNNIFENQKELTDAIRSKIDEAAKNIKDKRGALSSAFDQLASARDALFDALRGTRDVFADFNFALEKASVAADRVLGRFLGFRDEANALNSALEKTISAAAMAGASEQKLAELRQQAAEDQLALFTRLLDTQRSRAEKFFTSSADDRRGFVEGLAAIQNIAGQFNGNIDNFRGLSEGELNNFGRSLISLPQEVRQNIVGALDQLPDGVGIAGLTSDEIREIIAGGSLGESEEVGIERLSDTIETVAELTRQVAELNRSQVIAAQKSLVELQGNVAEAKEQVLIAKNALAQAKLDAQRTQGAIREVTATLNSQVGESREVFKQRADLIVKTIKDPAERQVALLELLVQFQQEVASKIGNTAGLVGNVGPDFAIESNRGGLPPVLSSPTSAGRDVVTQISKGIQDANKDLRNEIKGLTVVIQGNFVDNIDRNIKATESLSKQLATVASNSLQEVKAEISIDNTQKIQITGATEIAQKLTDELERAGFVTESDIRELRSTIIKIMEDNIRAGNSRPRIQLGGD